MNIKILDSWLRDFLQTKATAKQLANILSLTSSSVEHLEPLGEDFVYDIEITTNRPDLMSIVGLAREAGAILPQEKIEAVFTQPKIKEVVNKNKLEIDIVNDPKLVNRICAIALEINLKKSPDKISRRLEASDIRSLNNAVDVTNYVMREVGHPMHAFDYDKLLKTGKMIIRESKKGEKIKTLDEKEYVLSGGDIVADNGQGEIIDLLGVMGTQNSAVDDTTKRVLLFVDNNNQHRIRKTSMNLGIRTEAAILNEKGVDSELARTAVLRGAKLLEEIADGTIISELYDDYPNKIKARSIEITQEKINSVIGIDDIAIQTSAKILSDLGFDIKISANKLEAKVPSWRSNDVEIPEDIVEEVARVYGYHRLPTVVPGTVSPQVKSLSSDIFFWEARIRAAMKYWGLTEVYTYPMVSEDLLEGPISEAVTIKNPLTEDHIFMRRTLVPSLLEAIRENKNREEVRLFEIANVYLKRPSKLPEEKLMIGAVLKKNKASFFDAKGVVEALAQDMGIKNLDFKPAKSGNLGADVYIGKEYLGEIEQLDENVLDFELDFEALTRHANLKKIHVPASKYPESVEDLRFEIDETIPYVKIVETIKEQSKLIKSVALLDVYKNKKTFRVTYQSYDKNLTVEDLTTTREKIISSLKKNFKALPV